MNHLIIFAHPDAKSFNRAILDEFADALKSNGHLVRVRDLYSMKFNPALTDEDEQACISGTPPDDIRAEHQHIAWANIITFIGPLWWGGLPALAKGYMDRVLSNGFAYTSDENGPKGLLTDKKMFTIITGDAPENVYEQSGLFVGMNKIFDSIIAQFCEIQAAGHKYFMAVSVISDDERKAMLKEVRKIATELK